MNRLTALPRLNGRLKVMPMPITSKRSDISPYSLDKFSSLITLHAKTERLFIDSLI